MLLHILDITGALTAFAATICLVRTNILGWPLSILAIFINAYLYLWKGLYGETFLEFMYFVPCVYGWYSWYIGERENSLPITHISFQHFSVLLLIALTAIPFSAHFLQVHMHSQVPWLDAFATVLSLEAQWLSCRKIIENWIIWFCVDAMSIFLFSVKHIPYHALLYTVYLCVATIGWLTWYKIMRQEKSTSPTLSSITPVEI